MIGCAESTGESRDLRVATRKFTLSDDNRENVSREREDIDHPWCCCFLLSKREREREREIGEKKTRRVIDTFRGHVARGRGIMQHPRDTATLIIRGTRYRARLAVSLINRGDP